MCSLTELHPIFAGCIPDDNDELVECVLHNGFAEIIQEIEETECMFRGSWYAKEPEVVNDLIAMNVSVQTKPVSTPADKELKECRQELDTMLENGAQVSDVTALRNLGPPSSATPELLEDSLFDYSSSDSDIEDAAPAALTITKCVIEQPLTVATISKRPVLPTETPIAPRLLANPLTLFLSHHITPAPVKPLLNTKLTTPKKHVQFNASHSTRHFSSHSFSPDYLTTTFSTTHRSGAKRALLPKDVDGKRKRGSREENVRTCQVNLMNTGKHCLDDAPDEGKHESIAELYTKMRERMRSMEKAYLENLTSSISDTSNLIGMSNLAPSPLRFSSTETSMSTPLSSTSSSSSSSSCPALPSSSAPSASAPHPNNNTTPTPLPLHYQALSHRLLTSTRSLLRSYIHHEHCIHGIPQFTSCARLIDVSVLSDIVDECGVQLDKLSREYWEARRNRVGGEVISLLGMKGGKEGGGNAGV